MVQVLGNTILPIFSVIFLGYLLKLRQVVHPIYAKTANQLVYYVALPAMILRSTAQAPFRENFDVGAVLCTLMALSLLAVLALRLAKVLKVPESNRGTFLQNCFHGNIGYMSYAIAYFALGESRFAGTAILGSFLMIGQNMLALWALTTYRSESPRDEQRWFLLKRTIQNPIILSVAAGVLCSVSGFHVPTLINQSLDILSGMALPTALLLIGASLSFGAFRYWVKEMIGIGFLKLICMPALGYLFMRLLHVPDSLILSGVILLAAPPATISYVMASELGGNPELAATSISVVTLFSAITYSLFLFAFTG